MTSTSTSAAGRMRALLKSAWPGRAGTWLIIAVTKCDLFWNRIDEARDYYTRQEGSQETRAICPYPERPGELGGDRNFNRVFVPVSCFPRPYYFDSKIETQQPEFHGREAVPSKQLVEQFLAKVGE